MHEENAPRFNITIDHTLSLETGKEITRTMFAEFRKQKPLDAAKFLAIHHGALAAVLGTYTFHFRDYSLEDRHAALLTMVDMLEDVAKTAGELLLTHDAGEASKENTDAASSEETD